MKIVFLSRYQGVVQRGVENFVEEITRRLSKKHQVDIFSGRKSDSMEAISNHDYDIVIPLNGRLQSLKASLGRLFNKYKLLITGHSGIGKDDIWNIAIAKPDVFIALTEKEFAWANQWAWGSKVIKIPNGVDLKKYSPDGKKIKIDLPRPVILSVGALVWYKYHERIIDAMAKLNKGSLLIVGEGPLKEELMKMGRKLLGARFKITSYQYNEMPNVYRSVDLFTLPSWDRESFGLVYLEAMSSGLGVVAPDDSSRREIIGNGGLFVDVSNAIKYAEVIKQGLQIDWHKKARMKAEEFSWDRIAEEYEKVMMGLLS